jgi:hypothetical protein
MASIPCAIARGADKAQFAKMAERTNTRGLVAAFSAAVALQMYARNGGNK